MTSSNQTNSSYYSDNTNLDKIEYESFLSKDIPAVIFLSILSIIGVIGNIHTLLIYAVSQKMAKRTVRVFILWLSTSDFIACVSCMPFEICDIRFSYTFSSDGACKFFRFLDHVVMLTSGGFLTAIAIQRLKINMKLLPGPSGYSNFVLNSISAIIIGIATALSIPAFIFYGLNKKEIHFSTVVGVECSVLSKYQRMKIVGVYTCIVVLLSTACCIICIVCYGKILYVICKQMKKDANKYLKKNKLNVVNSTANETASASKEIDIQPNADFTKQSNTSQPKLKSHERSGYEKGRQLTISLIIATAVSYVGYIIFVGTILVKISNPLLYNDIIKPATGVLLRAYFISNSTNPIVFCLLDNTFRKECVKLYSTPICVRKISKR